MSKARDDLPDPDNPVKKIVNLSLENMVLQKFHTLFKRRVPEPFFEVRGRDLILNKNLLDLASNAQFRDLNKEVLGFLFFLLLNVLLQPV